MKNNKKGFTLVELLAVILILIIIIIIAINTVKNYAKSAKEKSITGNAITYIKASDSLIVNLRGTKDEIPYSASYSLDELDGLGLRISGQKPKSGVVSYLDNKVYYACLMYEEFYIEYKDGKYSDVKEGKCKNNFGINYNFDYTGKEQVATINITGTYKIELWGAQGGGTQGNDGGRGGYTSGELNLKAGDKLYFYVGGEGPANATVTNVGGWNGGGYSGSHGAADSYGGGGSTDVRLVGGNWKDAVGLRSRIMVAAGGGGSFGRAGNSKFPGAGGGLVGLSAYGNYDATIVTGGTQTGPGTGTQAAKIGSFGYAVQTIVDSWGGGGGGGYWGGNTAYGRGGSGGSSYISGYTGCVAVISSESNSPRTYTDPTTNEEVTCQDGTTVNECSIHYSEIVFDNPVMASGVEEMPTHDGKDIMVGNSGNGYAKIYLLSK